VAELNDSFTIVIYILYFVLDICEVEVNLRVNDVTHNFDCAFMGLLQSRVFFLDHDIEIIFSSLVPD